MSGKHVKYMARRSTFTKKWYDEEAIKIEETTVIGELWVSSGKPITSPKVRAIPESSGKNEHEYFREISDSFEKVKKDSKVKIHRVLKNGKKWFERWLKLTDKKTDNQKCLFYGCSKDASVGSCFESQNYSKYYFIGAVCKECIHENSYRLIKKDSVFARISMQDFEEYIKKTKNLSF